MHSFDMIPLPCGSAHLAVRRVFDQSVILLSTEFVPLHVWVVHVIVCFATLMLTAVVVASILGLRVLGALTTIIIIHVSHENDLFLFTCLLDSGLCPDSGESDLILQLLQNE